MLMSNERRRVNRRGRSGSRDESQIISWRNERSYFSNLASGGPEKTLVHDLRNQDTCLSAHGVGPIKKVSLRSH